MSPQVLRSVGYLLCWGVTLGLSLSISRWTSDWGHGVCGPWGCGPPIPSLIACHVSWLVVLVPIAIFGRRTLTENQNTTIGWIAIAFSSFSLAAFAIYERATWYARAAESLRPYFWNRVGFVIVTEIDLPILQLLSLGVLAVIMPQLRSSASTKPKDSQQTGADNAE